MTSSGTAVAPETAQVMPPSPVAPPMPAGGGLLPLTSSTYNGLTPMQALESTWDNVEAQRKDISACLARQDGTATL